MQGQIQIQILGLAQLLPAVCQLSRCLALRMLVSEAAGKAAERHAGMCLILNCQQRSNADLDC